MAEAELEFTVLWERFRNANVFSTVSQWSGTTTGVSPSHVVGPSSRVDLIYYLVMARVNLTSLGSLNIDFDCLSKAFIPSTLFRTPSFTHCLKYRQRGMNLNLKYNIGSDSWLRCVLARISLWSRMQNPSIYGASHRHQYALGPL